LVTAQLILFLLIHFSATDNHLGYNEKDPVRGNDSFEAFEEILQLARQLEVDALLLSGDLFHENKPSRKCIHTTMELLRHYCMGSRPCALELLSDPAVNFPNRFGTVNYEDPNYNVALPVFTIHGNHDDPTGDGNLSALDILSTAGLINYFGKSREVDDITMMPVLLKKGQTQMALYGLGNVRDERLHRTFLSRKVKMLAPPTTTDTWFNMLLFHQNRVAHGATSVIPESFLDESLDLVIWGHEHDNQIEPSYCAQRDFYVSQPGSSVATSLSEGECTRPKSVALLEVTGKAFKLHPIILKSVRPFMFGDVCLKDARPAIGLNDVKGIEKHLCAKIDELIVSAREEWLIRQGAQERESPLPLIRLKVDYSGGYASFNPHRFGHYFMNKIANPKDCVFFYRRRVAGTKGAPNDIGAAVNRAVASLVANDDDMDPASKQSAVKMDDLVHDYLKVQSLDLLPQNEFGDIVKIFVEKDDRDSIESFVKASLNRTCTILQNRAVRAFDEESLKLEIEKEKLQREMEWRRLHPDMDALLSHRMAYADVRNDTSGNDKESSPECSLNDSDLEELGSVSVPQKRTAAAPRGGRGRGRGRGKSSAVSGEAFSSLPMSSAAPPPAQSRWPSRR